MKGRILTIVSILVGYGLIAIVEWNINPLKWNLPLFFSLIAVFLIVYRIAMWLEKKR